jgi:hypothetical protein
MTADQFRAALAGMNLSQSALARRLIDLGAEGEFRAVLRTVQRMASGHSKVSNEMAALIGLMERTK